MPRQPPLPLNGLEHAKIEFIMALSPHGINKCYIL